MKALASILFILTSLLAPSDSTAMASETGAVPEGFLPGETPEPRPFVFNGDDLGNPGWIASITLGGAYTCAGSLVHQQWVLTAAHCVDDVDSSSRIRVGAERWYEGTERRLSQVHIHPDYQSGDLSSVDLAMVRLDSPISNLPLPSLSASATWPVIDQVLVVLGWGETSDNSVVPETLQGAGVWVDSDSTGAVHEGFCPRPWVAASGYEDFCFGGGVSWACSGDSGGPLVGRASPQHTGGSVRTLYGVTSFGDASGCSTAFWDSVGQPVGPHIEWIRSFFPETSASPGDEMFFYRSTDGAYRYYDMKPNGTLGTLLTGGTGYSTGWNSITAIDLDGDGQDEMFFYRSTDGAYRYYDMKPNGTLGTLLTGGTGYSTGWNSITAIDLDGDGQDEMFFYRSTDGAHRYYDMKPNGTLGTLLTGGTGYTPGWNSITAIDLDGDGQDEMFFYRSTDGAYRYYDMKPNGTLGTLLTGGTGYTPGWNSITAIDLDGDGQDEMFFYRSTDGAHRYYDMKPNGTLGTLLTGGTGYSTGWNSITAIDLGG